MDADELLGEQIASAERVLTHLRGCEEPDQRRIVDAVENTLARKRAQLKGQSSAAAGPREPRRSGRLY